MKKMFTLITAAVLLTANLSVGTVARAENIECNHNFVEETTIVHHDAEYATKTIWAKLDWYTFTGENKIGDGTNQFDLGTSAGTDGWYNSTIDRMMYCEDTIDTYDLVSYYYDYIDYLDYPDDAFLQRITIDNYADCGITYEEFCDQTDEYNFFGHLNPEFNPELDELVQFSWDIIGEGECKYDGEFYYDNVTSFDDLLNGPDGSSQITGSFGMVYGFGDDGPIEPYWPILQYHIPITEAYDEEVTQYVCEECGTVGTKNDDGTITVDLPAETTEPPAETTTTTVTTTTAAESTTTTTTAETMTPTETTTTAPSAYVVMSGDYNGDKEKTVADAILLARFVAEDSALTAEQLQKIISAEPDYNGDRLVTIVNSSNSNR